MDANAVFETDLAIGPRAIDAYSRLSYTMWYAFAEFIDNSTQSRRNYKSIIDDVLKKEGTPLVVEITYNRLKKEISIKDNSIGMTRDDLIEALRIAHPTNDSKGRSKYGMGLKTAACWIGRKWSVVTCEWSSGEEWTADVDVEAVAYHNKRIPLRGRAVDPDKHYTEIVISDLHRNIQKRTEETIRGYLGSMYQFDILAGKLKIVFNGEEVAPPEEYDFDTDPDGKPMRMDLPPFEVNGKKVSGWVAVLRRGGRKFGGFSLFQNQRQIQGFPNAWKPRRIFGGFDDEGANNLISQRLTGVIELDGFKVSHTKDAILFEGDEEEELEVFLGKVTNDYKSYALKRRGAQGQAWSREKVRDLVDSMKREFGNDEMKDAVINSMLPPLDAILSTNRQQLEGLADAERIATIDVTPDCKVIVSLQEKSEFEPYVTLIAGADQGTMHVIINGLHPYYVSLESADEINECIRQYIYDAIAEYRVSKLTARVTPDSVRQLKDGLLRVQVIRTENAAAEAQQDQPEDIVVNVKSTQ